MDNTTGDSEYPTYDFSSGGVLHWIKESFDNVVASITQGIESIGNWFSTLFEKIDEIKELIGGSKEDYNDFISSRGEYSDNEASSTLNDAVSDVQDSFSFTSDIKNAVNEVVSVISNTESTPSFSVYVDCWAYTGELKIIDLSWYAKYKSTGDNIICIFCYSAFLWYIFTRLPDIIQGAGASVYSGNMIEEISDYKRFGDFGYTRSSSFNSSWKGR